MTKNDVLNDNVDLIEHTAKILSGMPSFTLTGALAPGQSARADWTLTVQTKNLDRVDVLVEGRPRLTLDVKDGAIVGTLPGGSGESWVDLRGFLKGKLAASARLSVLEMAGAPGA